jgi:hypothetical protein
MPEVPKQLPPRRATLAENLPLVMFLALLCVVAAVYAILPALQNATMPAVSGGERGPWLVRPTSGLRLLATVAFAFACLFLWITMFYERLGAHEFKARYRVTKVGWYFGGIFSTLIAMWLLASCLFSWTMISPQGIEDRGLWGSDHYSFTQVRSISHIRDGMQISTGGGRSNNRLKGPAYQITMADKTIITISLYDGLISDFELHVAAQYISTQSEVPIRPHPDAKPR